MSLLKRIGGTPGATGQLPNTPAVGGAAAARPGAPVAPRREEENSIIELRQRVQQRLINELDPRLDLSNVARVRQQVEEIFNTILDSENIVLSRSERARLFESIAADILGFGPLQELLNDPEISEIMVNGPRKVYVEKRGKIQLSDVTFVDEQHVLRVIDRIVAPLGRRIDESSPMVDARLPDGSRVNAVIRPIALCGPTISIRKFRKEGITIEDLIRFGSLTREMAEFLSACVRASLNIVVSGGTGSGKTTMLNVLSSFIPDDERIITVENAAELQLRQEHVVPLESRPPNVEGKGEISIRDLVINTLRMRPERIVVGECRGGEALEMLQAMNTGHDGSMTTLHANSPRDAIARIETMCLMAGMDLPVRAIREQIASAVNLIVQLARLKDGSRKVIYITEVQGMEGDVVVLSDIFVFEQQGIDERGKIIGQLKPTGIRPRFIDRFEERNIYLPPNIFGYSSGSFF
ncbi:MULTISPECIES: CpaF family protein [Roseiflexus]|jgi:pilus assembly protein CpaF|uniref:Type II secretion system protein E n=1 Tax=Roseiflexus castenholzii (strain DSM 13941 / HLO8) TaxID=383372 RepID=A7NJV4_ROSCS|nr:MULTISPECIES: CpaF family protein [Roseiflexus]ABU57774.1 type II secretion system protein E [Roseiflexus castenholzii DSM 13941]PMP87928.1 MAG: CpaF family protein [Roseiflexus castenholzii]GIW00662.1 MAG: type II secretion system protein E [Roseiflexus sp.]